MFKLNSVTKYAISGPVAVLCFACTVQAGTATEACITGGIPPVTAHSLSSAAAEQTGAVPADNKRTTITIIGDKQRSVRHTNATQASAPEAEKTVQKAAETKQDRQLQSQKEPENKLTLQEALAQLEACKAAKTAVEPTVAKTGLKAKKTGKHSLRRHKKAVKNRCKCPGE